MVQFVLLQSEVGFAYEFHLFLFSTESESRRKADAGEVMLLYSWGSFSWERSNSWERRRHSLLCAAGQSLATDDLYTFWIE